MQENRRSFLRGGLKALAAVAVAVAVAPKAEAGLLNRCCPRKKLLCRSRKCC